MKLTPLLCIPLVLSIATYTALAESQISPTRNKLDLLLVVDSSGSMAEEQVAMLENFQLLLDALETAPGGIPSLNLAVITTDLGDGLDQITGCSRRGESGEFRSRGSSGQECIEGDSFLRFRPGGDAAGNNFEGSMLDALSCMGTVGIRGCGFEQPLAAIKKALDGSNPGNAGFLRSDAKLALVILTDEDDCSSDVGFFVFEEDNYGPLSSFRCVRHGLQCEGGPIADNPAEYDSCGPIAHPESPVHSPDRYVDFLRELKGENNVMVAVIAGDPTGLEVLRNEYDELYAAPSCESPNGSATPAHRLSYFAQQFSHSLVTSICNADLGPVLFASGKMMAEGFSTTASANGSVDASGCNGSGQSGAGLSMVLVLIGLALTRRIEGKKAAGLRIMRRG